MIASCNSRKIFSLKKPKNEIIHNIRLKNYDLFVFKMCKEYSKVLSDNDTVQKVSYPVYSLCTDPDNENVAEETYLFLPQEKQNDTVLYVTTFSHLHTQKDCGVFNYSGFQDKIFIEDIDGIYIGTKKDNSIIFKNKKQQTEWSINESSKEGIEIISITDLDRSKGKQVSLNEVFSLPVIFKPETKFFTYGRNDFINGEKNDCKDMEYKTAFPLNAGCEIEKVLTDKDFFYFKNSIDNYFRFKIKYRPAKFLIK